MPAESQTYFNVAILIFGGLGGWILNNLKDSLKSLQASDIAITTKVQSIEVLVAGTYVTRQDMDKMVTALFAKLDKIESKLDGKVDRDSCNIHHKGGA